MAVHLLSPWAVVLSTIVFLVLRRALYLFSQIRAVRGVPRYYCLTEPLSPWSALAKPSAWNPSIYHAWTSKDRYATRNAEIIQFVPLLAGDVTFQCASLEALKQMLNDLPTFTKPPRALGLKDIMGNNVVSTNGEHWRKHRKVTSPAFDNQIYNDVWRVTTGLYKQMMDSDAWKSGEQHYFKSFNVFTTRVALLVITTCGFNMGIDWEGHLKRDDMADSVDSTIVTVATSLMPRLILPRWIFSLPAQGLKRIDTAFKDLQRFLEGEVSSKRAELMKEKELDELDTSNKNLFTRVVMSSLQEGTKGLDDDEIIGNLFIYLFAGHETTASALATTLAMLALYKDEQARVYHHIMTTVGTRELTYEDYSDLAPVLHCFYEALRLYPPAPVLIRVPTQDASLVGPGLTPSGDSVVVPKGTEIILDIIGAGYNARNFPDPERFNPQRWASEHTLDNFLSFSVGPRGCLGRKFSTVEAVCFLTHLLRDWEIDVKLEGKETLVDWRERVMQPRIETTLRVENLPLLVTRRK